MVEKDTEASRSPAAIQKGPAAGPSVVQEPTFLQPRKRPPRVKQACAQAPQAPATPQDQSSVRFKNLSILHPENRLPPHWEMVHRLDRTSADMLRHVTTHTVTLYRSKDLNDPVDLHYTETDLRKSQARFLHTRVLEPQIDLRAYRRRAVVDWIDLDIALNAHTQFQWVNEIVDGVLGRKAWVIAVDDPRSDDHFRVRFQEPDFAEVREVLKRIDARYGLSRPTAISRLELSIDFYPQQPGDEARARMHGTLVRHFLPPDGTLAINDDWPGFVPGPKKGRNYVVGRNDG
jgi:hypothetical protein